LLDLNSIPPSEVALEGTLVVLKTMLSKPVELSRSTKVVDLYQSRPISKFLEDVPTLQSIGLQSFNVEHAFFLKCYMIYSADPSYCQDGILSNVSSIISLSPGGAFPPRASVLKKTPRKFRKIFKAQTASSRVTEVVNASLSLQPGGGLSEDEPLPSELHVILARFCHGPAYKNPSVPLSSQFVSFLQNGLTELDACLLRYISPIYKQCPLKVRSYKNGRQEVVKNTSHPAYEKWDSLISRTHFNPSYATTRVTFPWKGFYLPGGKVSNHRDKYAFFSFVYATDLNLGALPLWPLDAAAQFQLDRKDPLRHYTVDNVRWLERSDNMANKPSFGKEQGTSVKNTKDMLGILHACERNNKVCTEMLGALMKGYGS
jgi:hypothetical protein